MQVSWRSAFCSSIYSNSEFRPVSGWQSPSMCCLTQQQTSLINYPECPLLFRLPSRKSRPVSEDLCYPEPFELYLCLVICTSLFLVDDYQMYIIRHLYKGIKEKHFFTCIFSSTEIEQIISLTRPFEVPDDGIDKALPKISLICSSIKKIMKAWIVSSKPMVTVPGLFD